jgi:hypothetical protein
MEAKDSLYQRLVDLADRKDQPKEEPPNTEQLELASGETDREKCIRLFGKENPTWNDLVDAGYHFVSGKKIVKNDDPD